MHIFIGGTGSDGSSLLRSLLLKHKDICGNNFESRFTVSPDGIFEFLKNSHNTQNLYSYNVSLHRLFKLLETLKNNKSKKYFKNWNLSRSFSNYDKQIRLLKKKLLFRRYDGIWHGKYFYDENKYLYLKPSNEYITKHLSNFINNIHKLKIIKNKKKYFLDDNTWNLYFTNEIDNLNINYKLIHMIRDPRYTVMSLINQNWSPSNIKDASDFYLSMMDDILIKIKKINKAKILTVKYEDLINNREKELKKIFRYLNIANSNTFKQINVYNGNEKHNISSKNWKYLTKKLNYYIKYFNYNHRLSGK